MFPDLTPTELTLPKTTWPKFPTEEFIFLGFFLNLLIINAFFNPKNKSQKIKSADDCFLNIKSQKEFEKKIPKLSRLFLHKNKYPNPNYSMVPLRMRGNSGMRLITCQNAWHTPLLRSLLIHSIEVMRIRYFAHKKIMGCKSQKIKKIDDKMDLKSQK